MNSALLLCTISLLLPSCFKNSKIKERSESDAGDTDSASDATTTGDAGTVTGPHTDTFTYWDTDTFTQSISARDTGTGRSTFTSLDTDTDWAEGTDTKNISSGTANIDSNTTQKTDTENATDTHEAALNADTASGSDNTSDSESVTSPDIATDSEDTESSDTDSETECRHKVCAASAYCSDDGNVVCIDECGDLHQVEECVASNENGVCSEGACSCKSGFSGEDCQTCVPTNNGTEICDGMDNNCNGETDELFDFSSHPSHCGGCNNDCLTMASLWPDFGQTLPENMNAAACNQGACEVLICENGYTDDSMTSYSDCNFTVNQVVGGDAHTCALLMNKIIKCWGNNSGGRLGVKDNAESGESNPIPMTANLELEDGISILEIAAGGSHSCASLSDNTVQCWGNNYYGQLGVEDNIGSDEPNPTPKTVNLITDGFTIQKLAAKKDHSCVVLSNNTIHCWGRNRYGQLGNETNSGNNNPNPFPMLVALNLTPGISIQSIAAGDDHTCAALSDNTVKCWGLNYNGQLGIEDTSGSASPNPTPMTVDLNVGIQGITAGNAHTCVMLSDRTSKCWGWNIAGQLGVEENSNSTVPNPSLQTVNLDIGEESFHGIVAGALHTCVLLSDDSINCWGQNSFGELGVEGNSGSSEPNPFPVTVDLKNVKVQKIAAGNRHMCAVLSDNNIACWGSNSFGQLGSTLPGSDEWTYSPTSIQELY